ncbi:MAG: hypothetical protein ACFB4J_11845 [Elainellaceae cyanobacterium]
MKIKFTLTQVAKWASLLALVVSPMALCEQAVGQELEGSIQDEFEDAFFSHDEIFFNNRSIARQISFLIGAGFPDVEITQDGRAVHEVYETVLQQQAIASVPIRTPDLPNPYASTILTSPIVEEDVFINAPLNQPIPAPPRPVPSGPVPALW